MKIKKLINIYSRNYLVRFAVIVVVFFLWLLTCEPEKRDSAGEFAGFIFLGLIEILTTNTLTKRDFYPADLVIDGWFPNRDSFANKLGYILFYLLIAGFCVYMLLFELCSVSS